jgi:DNA repair protein RadC
LGTGFNRRILLPFESDLKMTKKIKDSGTLMDIQLLDYLIVVPEVKYYRMADERV